MEKLLVLCVDDEREVLDSVLNDLAPLREHFTVDGAENVAEAKSVIEDYLKEGGQLALILADHIMPVDLGIDFLIDLNQQESTLAAKKILLTGQAELKDTIAAINRGGLNYYLAKPWSSDELQRIVKDKLTDYVLEHSSNPLPYASVLDSERIFGAVSKGRLDVSSTSI